MKHPIRVLQIVPSINKTSGVCQVVLNWHRHISLSELQFDYLYTSETTISNMEEINSLGGRCYKLPNPVRHPFRFFADSCNFFKEHRYNIVHSHQTSLNFFFYPLAKIFGAKYLIHHSHLTKWSDKVLSGIRNYVMMHAVWPLITHKFACSKDAGEAYYGKGFTVVNNGIDVSKFSYSAETRAKKRKELGLEKNFVIGHIGRFNIQKNHVFLIEIFERLLSLNPNAKLLLVGNGPLEDKIKKIVKEKNIQESVIFLGARNDVSSLYQAFDCFVFPSLHEGLGIVAIEAQCSGLPCVLADTLPHEAFICNYRKLGLGNPEVWAENIVDISRDYNRADCSEHVKAAGFDSKNIGQFMQNFYLEL